MGGEGPTADRFRGGGSADNSGRVEFSDVFTGGVAGCIFDEFGTRFGPEFHNFLALAHHFLRSEFGREICLKNVWIWDWPQVVK